VNLFNFVGHLFNLRSVFCVAEVEFCSVLVDWQTYFRSIKGNFEAVLLDLSLLNQKLLNEGLVLRNFIFGFKLAALRNVSVKAYIVPLKSCGLD